jgi:hypothetical protein
MYCFYLQKNRNLTSSFSIDLSFQRASMKFGTATPVVTRQASTAAATSLGVVPSCAVKLVNLGGTATAPSEGYK